VRRREGVRGLLPALESAFSEEHGPVASRLERYFAIKCLGVFVLLALVKSRAFFPQGRFWAEEGADFYVGICAAPGLAGLGFLFNNHLELWTNLGVLLATRVPLEMAPAVTTLYALVLQALPLVLIGVARRELGLSRLAVLVLIVVSLGMPQSREVWANTINLHFHFALLAALILLLPARGGMGLGLGAAALLACGLSGVPANFLAPLFLAVALWEKSPARALQAAVLGATALLQVWLLLSSGYDGVRDMMPRPDVILLAGITQSFYTLIGSPIAGHLSADLFLPLVRGGAPWQLAFGGAGVLGTLWLVVRICGPGARFRPERAAGRRNIRLVLGLAVLLSASVTLAIGDSRNLVSPHYGGRYFYVPNMLVALLLLSGAAASLRPLRAVAIMSMALFALLGVPRFYGGPDWAQSLAQARLEPPPRGAALSVAVWPQGWRMEVPAACQDSGPRP
jgi:hypothetical protein